MIPDAFAGRTAGFATGLVAFDGVALPGRVVDYDAAALLRVHTYLDRGYVKSEALDDRGTELDADDDRSAHFVVLERLGSSQDARVVGTMRLVVKQDKTPLPLERMCPDAFTAGPAPSKSTEVSRWICRHEDRRLQQLLKWPLFLSGLGYIEMNRLGPVYGLLREDLANSLTMQGVPTRAIAPSRFVEEINATKQPFLVDLVGVRQSTLDAGFADPPTATSELVYFDLTRGGELRWWCD